MPGTPALRATSRSSASGPRTSPTIRHSGRMRKDSRTRSRSVISPVPSAAAGRVCMATWSQFASPSSKTSSQEMTRRERGNSPASARRSVVLPACVPPDTSTDRPTPTAAARKSRIGGGTMSAATRSSRVRARWMCLRMLTLHAWPVTGGIATCKRSPPASIASTKGLDRSRRLPE